MERINSYQFILDAHFYNKCPLKNKGKLAKLNIQGKIKESEVKMALKKKDSKQANKARKHKTAEVRPSCCDCLP